MSNIVTGNDSNDAGIFMTIAFVSFCPYYIPIMYSSCFEIPEVEHANVASRSGCSWAKPTAHIGLGISSTGTLPLQRETFVSPYETFVSPYETFVSPYETFVSPYETLVSPYETLVSPYETL
ncbi:MAG: hypothetical protein LBJ00_16305, partial [Planctomycetaceae bacterium]|nr:hypothetical protein [Planctomycetaceae bacterium]